MSEPETPETAQEPVPAPVPEVDPTPAAPAAEEKPQPAGEKEAKPAEDPAAAAAKRKKRKDLIMDGLLVLALVLVLGTGGWYICEQMAKYRIPTPMEQAMQENDKLTAKLRELTPAYVEAQHVLALQSQYLDLQTKVREKENELLAENRKCADTISGTERLNRRILALQHQIRTVDASNRQIAYNMLPGMNIGDVTTTTGKAFRNATIKHLDKKLIVLSTPDSMSRFPVKQLVKENLPPLALYAFNRLDLVDMSDFEAQQDGDTPAPARKKPVVVSGGRKTAADYDQSQGGPVVDTAADATDISFPEDEDVPSQDDGLAPE